MIALLAEEQFEPNGPFQRHQRMNSKKNKSIKVLSIEDRFKDKKHVMLGGQKHRLQC